MSDNHVVLRAVTKEFDGTAAVNQVDLELKAGQCVALAGHNGAGKSTMIKLMLGLLRPTHGQIEVLGRDPMDSASEARRSVGYLPETVALYPAMTGIETLAYYARLKGQSPARNIALLERVGIAQAARRRVGGYSKGMRQRLALAQALLGEPQVLFMDEPTTGLDPASRQVFYEIVRELRDRGATILLCSHALAELEGQADRIVIMKNGSKVADGTLGALRQQADMPVTIRVALAQPLADVAALPPQWQVAGPFMLELRCKPQEKVTALKNIWTLGAEIADIDVVQPGLDEMYAHFLRREEA
ncbi:ABC transporter ATP-binding protein [Corticimicrobacter populi]|uniref:ABC transporter ATP-binding protein n=1 Tax=Corticimicrobacter populi TaxID=2175229 RepID=A0A2V1JU58_9BURK|nr:ABC transporter ATP-binding protein [Corticimicrobacter populi]PWF21521.1 ABC transporter ATP-binding protein [Corticimicrobacter populi]